MATDYTEKIAGLEEQIAQLENRRRELLQKNKEQERKARTKRLIESGAIIESVMGGMDELTGEQFKVFIERIANTDQARRALEEAKRQDGGRPAPKPTIPKPEPAATDDEDGEADGKRAD
jgi:TolA-binding protein